MEENEGASSDGISNGYVAAAAFGSMLLVFAAIPEMRPVVFVLLWAAGPIVAYGTLVQVFRGSIGLQSAAGIVFALLCGLLAFVTIPLGFLAVSESLARGLQFLGFGAAVLAIGFARLSVDPEPTPTDRYLPPVDIEDEPPGEP